MSLRILVTGALALSIFSAPALAEDEQETDAVAPSLAEAATSLHGDMATLGQVHDSARSRMRDAKAEAHKLNEQLEADSARVAEARRIVGTYLRSIYMNGPTELTMIASIVDSEDPAELIRRSDEALRVGEHKEAIYLRAVALLKRTEELQSASQAALDAARNSLNAIEDQVAEIRGQLADVANDWAEQISAVGAFVSQEQIARNVQVASSWANYLETLSQWRVPPVTIAQLQSGDLPEGVTATRKKPGVALAHKDGKTLTVLPERTIASVTYAVSRMGTKYEWRKNTSQSMDCSALVDRAWNVPSLPSAERGKDRAPVAGGARRVASGTPLVPANRSSVGDLVFLTDAPAGVNHVGIMVDSGLMVAADAKTGAVNAVPIEADRVWSYGRQSLKSGNANKVPGPNGKRFQCGAYPDTFIALPNGGTLANPESCPAAPGRFGEGHLQEATIIGGRCVAMLWPSVTTIGGWRPTDPYPDHPSGRAIDVMMPALCSDDPENVNVGHQIATFFMKNAEKFNVHYIGWYHRIWNAKIEAERPVKEWRLMSERGSCTHNHMDHVHITFNGPNIAPGIDKVVTRQPDQDVVPAEPKGKKGKQQEKEPAPKAKSDPDAQ